MSKFDVVQRRIDEQRRLRMMKCGRNPEVHRGKVVNNLEEYNLLFPTVKRGEIYRCDFSKPFGCEFGYERYALIVQNDVGNKFSPTTIVISATTAMTKKDLPVHYEVKFSNDNMVDYDASRVGKKLNILMGEQIHTVDKRRLRSYIGTMKDEYICEISKVLKISLGIEDNQVSNLNITQIKLLSLVDINILLELKEASYATEEKILKILALFGFDIDNDKRVSHLFKMVLLYHEKKVLTLDQMYNVISLGYDKKYNAGTIKEMINTLIMSKFNLSGNDVAYFIQLVNTFLTKEEYTL